MNKDFKRKDPDGNDYHYRQKYSKKWKRYLLPDEEEEEDSGTDILLLICIFYQVIETIYYLLK